MERARAEGEGGEGEGGEAKGGEVESEGEGEGGEAKGGEGKGEGGDAKGGEGQGERTDGPGNARELVQPNQSWKQLGRVLQRKRPRHRLRFCLCEWLTLGDAILGILMSECGAECETWPCE